MCKCRERRDQLRAAADAAALKMKAGLKMMADIAQVTLVPRSLGIRDQLYDVAFAGEVIVKSSRDPEHDAARALLARGITGRMETLGSDGKVRMHLTIEKAAELTVTEANDRGLELRRWKASPFASSEPPAAEKPPGGR
jgi:hypothetical protein